MAGKGPEPVQEIPGVPASGVRETWVAIDPASEGGDHTAICTFSRGSDGVLYVEDVQTFAYRGPPRPPRDAMVCLLCFNVYINGQPHDCPARKTVIFEYIIVEHPSQKEKEKGTLETILKGVTLIAARDLEHAKTRALLEYGQESGDSVPADTRIEVLARPFK